MSATGWTSVDESKAPAGWTPVDETKPSKVEEYTGKALSAAGLPTSISNIPDWLKHLTGTHPDSQPFWEPIRNAIKNPTQENIVAAVPFVGPASIAMSKDVQAGNYGGAAATLAGTVAGVVGAGQVRPGMAAKAALKNVAEGAAPTATAAERMYQSALKPGPGSYSLEQVKGMVRTGLENEIPVSASGVEKLSSLVDDLNGKIKAQIDAGSKAGATVNKYAVASRLSGTASKFATQVNPEADLGAVSEAGNEFLRNQPAEISASEAQAMKQGTYAQLKSRSYGELKGATVESQKALARGIKEELAQQFPEIGQLNAKESQLFGLEPALERAVRRIDNHQLLGIGTPLAASAATAITSSAPVGAAAAIMKLVLDNPVVKSKLAIALNRKGVALAGAYSRVAAYSAALANAQPRAGQNNEQ